MLMQGRGGGGLGVVTAKIAELWDTGDKVP